MEQVRAGRGEVRVLGNQGTLASSLPAAVPIQLSQVFMTVSWCQDSLWDAVTFGKRRDHRSTGNLAWSVLCGGPRASGNCSSCMDCTFEKRNAWFRPCSPLLSLPIPILPSLPPAISFDWYITEFTKFKYETWWALTNVYCLIASHSEHREWFFCSKYTYATCNPCSLLPRPRSCSPAFFH